MFSLKNGDSQRRFRWEKGVPHMHYILILLLLFGSDLHAESVSISSGTITADDFLLDAVESGDAGAPGELVSRRYRLEPFTALDVNSTFDAQFVINFIPDDAAKEYSLIDIHCAAGVADSLSMEVKGDSLFIEPDLPLYSKVDITVRSRSLISIKSVGQNTITIKDLNCDSFSAYLNGKTQLELSGGAQASYFDLVGPARLKAHDFHAGKVVIYAKDTSRAWVSPIQALKAVSYAAAEIYYLNEPAQMIKKVKAFGKIAYSPAFRP